MKYVQVVIPDEWQAKLKMKCIAEKITLAQKLLGLIGAEIGEELK
ncbi:MAG: hypothetical protein ACLP29_08090 [Dissulfurispiraceae bacterium]